MKSRLRQLNWQTAIREQVRIYRNLNNGTMSIQQRIAGRWLVTGHITNCIVENVTFFVSQSGRARVLRDARKNVHAWGQGTLVAQFDPELYAPIALAYDPYINAAFVQRHTQDKIVQCRYLVVRENRVFVSADAVLSSPSKPAESTPLFQFPVLCFAA